MYNFSSELVKHIYDFITVKFAYQNHNKYTRYLYNDI